jgi:MerR family transcriptional regulator/heat shock protein HspR
MTIVDEKKPPLDDPDYPLYTVAQVSELLGVSAAALRRWEREHLVAPERSQGRQRRYSRRQIEQLQQVVQLAEDGLTTAGIRKIQQLQDRIGELEDELAKTRAEQADPPLHPPGSAS